MIPALRPQQPQRPTPPAQWFPAKAPWPAKAELAVKGAKVVDRAVVAAKAEDKAEKAAALAAVQSYRALFVAQVVAVGMLFGLSMLLVPRLGLAGAGYCILLVAVAMLVIHAAMASVLFSRVFQGHSARTSPLPILPLPSVTQCTDHMTATESAGRVLVNSIPSESQPARSAG